VRKVLIVALVVLAIVAGVPLLVMGMSCPSCSPSLAAASPACFAILVSAIVWMIEAAGFVRPRRQRGEGALHVFALERPPRLLLGR
jgi:hypothetical protein